MPPPDSEAALWRVLRAKQLGIEFRRQVPVLCFIVDFLAPAARLIVEIDGGYHEQRVRADARRDEELRRAGYRVPRFQAQAVMQDLPGVLECVRAALK